MVCKFIEFNVSKYNINSENCGKGQIILVFYNWPLSQSFDAWHDLTLLYSSIWNGFYNYALLLWPKCPFYGLTISPDKKIWWSVIQLYMGLHFGDILYIREHFKGLKWLYMLQESQNSCNLKKRESFWKWLSFHHQFQPFLSDEMVLLESYYSSTGEL